MCKALSSLACWCVLMICATHASAAIEDNVDNGAGDAAGAINEPALPNAMWVASGVISGGSPLGDEGFAALQRLGVQTVLSVDGARPDLAAAKRHGLAYVHLPHGYDDVPADRAKQLAKAVADLPGPIYIHCHHGKHRSPAAAAVACVGAGRLAPEDAGRVLTVAGTSPRYVGLFAAVADAERIEQAVLDAIPTDFPEVSEPPRLVQSMLDLEHAHDHLREIRASGWQTPAGHPDLTADHEALLLREHYTELLRLEELAAQPRAFRELAQQGRDAAGRLEVALQKAVGDQQRRDAAKALDDVAQNCRACHSKFRDAPSRGATHLLTGEASE